MCPCTLLARPTNQCVASLQLCITLQRFILGTNVCTSDRTAFERKWTGRWWCVCVCWCAGVFFSRKDYYHLFLPQYLGGWIFIATPQKPTGLLVILQCGCYCCCSVPLCASPVSCYCFCVHTPRSCERIFRSVPNNAREELDFGISCFRSYTLIYESIYRVKNTGNKFTYLVNFFGCRSDN